MESPQLTERVYLPKTGANEVTGSIRHWDKESGAKVSRGDLLGEIETSKAIVEIEAEADGWFYPLAKAGESAEVGTVIAVIADRSDADVEALKRTIASSETRSSADGNGAAESKSDAWTRKAQLLAARHGLDRDAVERFARDAKRITEEHVTAFMQTSLSSDTQQPSTSSSARRVERVLVIGSAAGGGATIVVDSLSRSPHQIVAGIVDRDESQRGRNIGGVPVLGSSDPDEVVALYKKGLFDVVVLAFNRDVDARARVFEDLRARGIPFTNVVDATVNLRNAVAMGIGNVILGSSYVGPEAEIGDNNFLSSNTCIEHHCRLGSHNAFGPAVAFSGKVVVGDRVRFGTQIAVEPGVSIGSDSIIASSCVITADVPARSLLRAKVTFTVSPRPEATIVSSYEL